ncbi:MAG TPA: hypothetical protein VHY91_07995 [Pirellulales bacterium]|jgi:hypothetical protein|nr:hypothetical protein [Pirellulales bacterium]
MMNCRECQDVLDNLLIAEPVGVEEAALAEHLENCPDCAGQYAQARRALAALTAMDRLAASPDLKQRIIDAVAGASVPAAANAATRMRRIRRWQIAASIAAAAMLLVAIALRLHSGGGAKETSAFGLLAEARAADENLFAGKGIIHLVNEIVVVPVADPALAKIRWLPLMSLEATGKPRADQLTLPAEAGEGYTVEDQSWYEPATGRFARVLTRDGKPIFANSYDGKNVYVEESPAAGPPRIVSHPVTDDFQAPKSPADFLGMAAGLRSGLDLKDASLVSDAGTTKLDDGAEARVVKLGLRGADGKEPADNYWLVTIRADNHTLEKEEWIAQGKPLLVIRRGKAEPDQGPGMGWDLAGLAKQFAAATVAGWPKILPDMVIPDVSVEHMVKKADFKTYVFSKSPSWAGGERQIADILDLPSPPHRGFSVTYPAKDHRHVVLFQSLSYNKVGQKLMTIGKLIYTSPTGVKVWSGPKDEWLAGILLQSARYAFKDPPAKEISGYVLETPAGTFPALAINGKLSDEELHSLIDSLVPAE